jgi:hypothetical protein
MLFTRPANETPRILRTFLPKRFLEIYFNYGIFEIENRLLKV